MNEQRYTVMMGIYFVLFVVSYGLCLLMPVPTRNWPLIVALVTAVTGLIRSLQRPYQKTEESDEG